MLIILLVLIILIALYFVMTQSLKLPCSHQWIVEYKFAHRGLHNANCPENTLGAFKNAVKQGYAIELDVQLSKDGKVVVFHDKSLERLAGKSGKISDYTADELKSFKINGSVYNIPLFSEVLELVNCKVPLLIETKNEGFAGALEKELYTLLKRYNGKYAVQSFSPFSIRWFKINAHDILRGQLSSDFKNADTTNPKIFEFSLKHLLINFIGKPQFISYDKHGIECLILKRLKKYGTAILCWTIENSEEQNKVKPFSNSIIFENYEPSSNN